jgi:L-aspartate semialdehyde sulfurtransferase ferredoxin
MTTRKIMLSFPVHKTETPIVYQLVKDFDLVINIFRAKVTPEDEGYLVLDVTGEDQNISRGIEFIESLNITVTDTQKALFWNSEKCVHCGNCLTHCPTAALHIKNEKTREISFDDSKCIECLSCIENCPFGACSSIF